MQNYLDFLDKIMTHGEDASDRTGVGTRRLFNHQMTFDISNQTLPLVTTKKCHFKSIVVELLWFLRGDTNTQFLKENGVRIWDEWADANGDLGPVYGHQWRHWPTPDGHIDQIDTLLHDLKNNPYSRRHIISAWNVSQLHQMALPPCHAFFQFYVSATGKLSCKLTQRSADAFLGVPFNIASYALLTQIIAHHTDLTAHEFIWSGGDCHIYHNHFDQVKVQLKRAPLAPPQVQIHHQTDLDAYLPEHFKLHHYDPHPGIKAPIAI
ncbi:thymidylate synthase [Gammaproteobacteria bacterium]|nr:thymidylate synthase [Gammaproteobacteria bacterium]